MRVCVYQPEEDQVEEDVGYCRQLVVAITY